MGKIYQGIEELVGHTPLVNFRRLAKAEGVNAEILAKLECFNPAGSAKDRVGLQMVLDAEKAGILKRGSGKWIYLLQQWVPGGRLPGRPAI